MATQPYLTPPQAAPIAGVTRQRITVWCKICPGLGWRVAGRWRINPAVLERILNGEYPMSDWGRTEKTP